MESVEEMRTILEEIKISEETMKTKLISIRNYNKDIGDEVQRMIEVITKTRIDLENRLNLLDK